MRAGLLGGSSVVHHVCGCSNVSILCFTTVFLMVCIFIWLGSRMLQLMVVVFIYTLLVDRDENGADSFRQLRTKTDTDTFRIG